jgi:hypothetical protein
MSTYAPPALQHLDGCPVVTDPTPENLARIETYTHSQEQLKTNVNGVKVIIPGKRTHVSHCVECGAMSYTPEEASDGQ